MQRCARASGGGLRCPVSRATPRVTPSASAVSSHPLPCVRPPARTALAGVPRSPLRFPAQRRSGGGLADATARPRWPSLVVEGVGWWVTRRSACAQCCAGANSNAQWFAPRARRPVRTPTVRQGSPRLAPLGFGVDCRSARAALLLASSPSGAPSGEPARALLKLLLAAAPLLAGAPAVASRAAGVPPTLAGCCARAASIAAPRLADAPAWALRGRPEGGKLWWLTYTP